MTAITLKPCVDTRDLNDLSSSFYKQHSKCNRIVDNFRFLCSKMNQNNMFSSVQEWNSREKFVLVIFDVITCGYCCVGTFSTLIASLNRFYCKARV
jgi:hypothetical protein